MTTRYVNAKKGKTTGAFDTKNAPARTLRAALGVAKPGDTIEILDAATYKEGELVIDKPLTIVSSYAIANPGADPTNPLFDAKKFPELTPASKVRARVLRVMGTQSTRVSAGPVVLTGLRITGGHAVHTSSDPALGAGGGIAVIDIDNVTIERCVITGNSTETAASTAWPESDRLAFRTAVLDLAGEIVSVTVETMVNTMINAANIVLNVAGQRSKNPTYCLCLRTSRCPSTEMCRSSYTKARMMGPRTPIQPTPITMTRGSSSPMSARTTSSSSGSITPCRRLRRVTS